MIQDSRFKLANQDGFIALMSALVISLILVGMTFALGTAAFYTRFDVLASENKRISLGLAESCVNVVMLRLAQHPTIAPDPETIQVGADTEQSCDIRSVTFAGAGNPKIATIQTHAQYRGSNSNVKTTANVSDPTLPPPPPPPPPAPVCADTVVMIDRSGSINDADYIKEKAAATGLVDLYEPLTPNPLIGFGAFGTSGSNADAQILQTLTTNYPTLNSIINGAPDANSYTDLQSAISLAQHQFEVIADDKQKVLILISDGLPNRSSVDSLCNNPSGDDDIAALCAADQAKLAYSHIFTVHYGDANGRDFLAKLASGTFSNSGHQPGSANNTGTSNTPAVINAENIDGDYFYVSPTADQLQAIFTEIGAIVCPEAVGGGAPSLPPSTILPGSWQETP